MVILENIKLNNGIIECDYNPEKSGEIGHIILNGDETNIEYSKYKYGKQIYAQKSVAKLRALLESGENVPSQTAITWY